MGTVLVSFCTFYSDSEYARCFLTCRWVCASHCAWKSHCNHCKHISHSVSRCWCQNTLYREVPSSGPCQGQGFYLGNHRKQLFVIPSHNCLFLIQSLGVDNHKTAFTWHANCLYSLLHVHYKPNWRSIYSPSWLSSVELLLEDSVGDANGIMDISDIGSSI